MDDILTRGWADLLAREHGPLTFRLIIQPAVAVALAVRAGWKDDRERRPAFFWALVWDVAHRRYLVRQGWKDVGRLFLVAIVMDVIYQVLVHRWVYPGETLVIATLLAIVPYLVLRGPTNRVAAGMHWREEPAGEPADAPGSLAVLAALSLLVGVTAGLVGAVFRLALAQADRWRDAVINWAHGANLAGLVLVTAGCAAATGVAAWLVRRFSPYASGSGIPHVEAVLNRDLPQAPFWLIPVKFVGGLLAIGSGLALGREGPSVQMGASLAHLLGKVFRRPLPDCLELLAAGAGAGLATAFNAPIAGAVFVLEELVRRFDTRITIATFGASTGAIAVSRVLLGHPPDFDVAPLPYPSLGVVPIFLALGLLSGLLGVAYNHTLLGALALTDRLRRCPVELQAAVVGAAVGLLAWFTPGLVGGGDAITQATLSGTEALAVLSLVFVLRFALGAVSYAARTPGGLFAPMLVLGAVSGRVFGDLCSFCSPLRGPAALVPDPTALAVVGMAAFFTGVVRSPLTGIILVIEMTGSFTLLLPMLGASFAAMLAPTLLGNPPIYDSLRERTLQSQQSGEDNAQVEKTRPTEPVGVG